MNHQPCHDEEARAHGQIQSWDEAKPDAEALWLLRGIRDFSPLSSFAKLRTLWVWSANPQQLQIIGGLSALTWLSVAWLRAVEDLSPLAGLHDLRTLHLEGSLRGISLEPVGQLRQLRELKIWSLVSSAVNGKFATVASFAPLANLADLEHLELFFVKPLDGTVKPLARLKHLKELDLPNAFPLEDMARLAALLPTTKAVFQSPFYVFKADDVLKCKRCSGPELAVLVGASMRAILCPVCDAQRIDRHVKEYERLKQEFASSGNR